MMVSCTRALPLSQSRHKLRCSPEILKDLGSPRVDIIKNKRDLFLQTYFYEVENPAAILLAVHGYASHFRFDYLTLEQRYEASWVQKMNDRGVSVYGFDLTGHGLSDGWKKVRCNIDRFEDFVDDALLVLRHLQKNFPQHKRPPLIVMGLSMGGNIAAQLAMRLIENSEPFSALVLLSPMLSIDKIKQMNSCLLPTMNILAEWFPHLPLGAKEPLKKEILDAVRCDPLWYRGLGRARMGREIFRAVDVAMKGAPLLNRPLLVCHSKIDTVCEPKGSSNFVAAASQAPQKRFLCDYPSIKHNLPNEKGNEKVFEDIMQFLSDCSIPVPSRK